MSAIENTLKYGHLGEKGLDSLANIGIVLMVTPQTATYKDSGK